MQSALALGVVVFAGVGLLRADPSKAVVLQYKQLRIIGEHVSIGTCSLFDDAEIRHGKYDAFEAVLFRMYQRYAGSKGWRVEVISSSDGEHGGYKEIIANIYGAGAFANMKFESGVHRVQRVPNTETQGRIHTSAATVAVLPEAEEVDIKIEDKDLRIDVYRSSGPGGQSVNTTDSAVRITHIPTGLAVAQQTEKSQLKNKNAAMKLLRARLYEMERSRIDNERSATRKGQVGSGDRSERIRTYNFPQGRLTDHRINLTLYKLPEIIEGPALEEVVRALITDHQATLMAEQDAEA